MHWHKKVEVVISWIVRYQMKTQPFSDIIEIHNNSYIRAMVLSQHISCIPSIKATMDTAHDNNAMLPPPLTLPTPIRVVTERGGGQFQQHIPLAKIGDQEQEQLLRLTHHRRRASLCRKLTQV
jgi:hypothetical protein